MSLTDEQQAKYEAARDAARVGWYVDVEEGETLVAINPYMPEAESYRFDHESSIWRHCDGGVFTTLPIPHKPPPRSLDEEDVKRLTVDALVEYLVDTFTGSGTFENQRIAAREIAERIARVPAEVPDLTQLCDRQVLGLVHLAVESF